jgi:cell division septal protein FtsQ
MSRFYFDFYDGPDLTPDEDGLELDNLEAAEHEAVLTAVQLGRDWLPQAREVRLAVRDGQRRLVLTLNLALVIERLAQPGLKDCLDLAPNARIGV